MSKNSDTPEPAEGLVNAAEDLVQPAPAAEAAAIPAAFALGDEATTATHTSVAPVVDPHAGALPDYLSPEYAPPAYAAPGAVPPGSIPPGAVYASQVEPADGDPEASKARKKTLLTALVGAGVGLIAGLSLGIGGTMLASDDHDGRGFDSTQHQGARGRGQQGGQVGGNQQGGQVGGNQQGGQVGGNQQGGQVPGGNQQGGQGGFDQQNGQPQGGFDQQRGAMPGGQLPGGQMPGGMSRSGGS